MVRRPFGDEVTQLLLRPVLENPEHVSSVEPIFLRTSKETTISFGSIINRIVKELKQSGHKATAELASWFIAISCAYSTITGRHNSASVFNFLIDNISDGDVNLYYIFEPRVSPEYRYRVGRFTSDP
jgi:hypothetical protein